MSNDKTWTEDEIRSNLRSSDKWVARAIAAIHDLQTESEKRTKSTKRYNNVGFNSVDAGFLSDLAESYKKYGSLTDAQIEAGREAIMKYAGQLTDIANDNIGERRN